MPASRKPDLIPVDAVPSASAAPERNAWTMSFETDVEEEEAPVPRTAAPTLPQAFGPPNALQDDAKVGQRPSGPQEDSKITRRPLAGRPRSESVNASLPREDSVNTPRPLAQTRGTGVAASAPGRGRERTRGPAGAMAAEGKQVRLLPGRRVPGTRYRLVRWLGEGGMGVVYEAEHEDIERRVALKILRIEASEDPHQAGQFRDEARAASRIGSPNIVEIFDFGELPDGRLMFAMELLNGHGLDTELDKCPMDPGRMIAILRQVCKGLAAAHEVGIIHRDVKPDNIIVLNVSAGGVNAGAANTAGRTDRVKVVDFGIATMHAEGDTGAAGTPHYMAPEQVLGQPFDGRLDMYSLGCTAYELLVGKPPFVAQTVDEILHAQLERTPVPPSQLCPAGAVHPALEAVILRCLEKSPDRRFADMHDLEAALCEAQIAAGLRTAWDDLPLPAVDAERQGRLARDMPQPHGAPSPRRRWLWPAIAGASTLVAAGVTALLLLRQPGPAEPGAEAEVEALTNAARAAAGRANWVIPPKGDPAATAYRKVTDLEALTGPVKELGHERASALRGEFATALVNLGDTYWEKDGGKAFARDYYLQALTFDEDNPTARERAGATPGTLADFRDRAAQGTFSEADLRAAAPLIALAEQDETKRAEKLLALAETNDSPASSAASLDRLIEATAGKAPARQKPRRDPDDDRRPPPVVDPFAGDPSPTTPDPVTKAAPIAKRDTKQSNQLVKDARAALAKGNQSAAETLFHQALSYDNRNAAALIGLSDLEFDRGKHQRAADYAEKATAAAPKNGGYHLRLGDAYFKLLRYADARRAYQKAKDLGVSEANERLDKLRSKLGG